MPTPFTHLKIAQDLLVDQRLPEPCRGLLLRERPAFQLGSVAADARVATGVSRDVTHFFSYSADICERPWLVMLREHASLTPPRDEAHLAFLAGYVAHLALDEAWTLNLVRPRFRDRAWQDADRGDKYFALHLILTVMDERDEACLEAWQADSLKRCQPREWLPFISDEVLLRWRDVVAEQIGPARHSLTLEIFAERLKTSTGRIRATLDDPAAMQHALWRHVPRGILQDVESQAYIYTREQMLLYLAEYMSAPASV